MRVHTSFFILVVAIFCGCSREHTSDGFSFRAGHGDVGRFILQQAIAGGGHVVITNSLPLIAGSWSYSEDNDGHIIPKDAAGTVIRMPREQYQSLETFFRQAFGEPASRTVGNPNQKGWALDVVNVYRLSAGMGIQFGYNQEYTLVVMIRPTNSKSQ